MRVLILAAAFLCVASAAQMATLTRIDTKRKRLYKKGLWAKHLKKKLHIRSTKFRSKIGERVYDYDDLEYVANISIGTPVGKQAFTVVLDTGSSNVWIPEIRCKTGDCKKKNLYDPQQSPSYREDGRTWSIYYGDGSGAQGILGIDTMSFVTGGDEALTIPNVTFGMARQLNGFEDDPVDGIVGLAFKPIAVDGVTPPLITAIEEDVLLEPVFTVWLQHQGAQENVFGGIFSYGVVDNVNCGPVIAYEPLTSATYWQFRLRGIKGGSYSMLGTWDGISDTGTSLIAGPAGVVEALAQAFDTQFDEDEGMFFIGCQQREHNVTLVIGSHDYVIEPNNFIIAVDKDTCMFSFTPHDGGSFGPTWIFGDPFIRQYCQIYDIGRERIGFAPSLQSYENAPATQKADQPSLATTGHDVENSTNIV